MNRLFNLLAHLIGTGKTTCATYFIKKGAFIFDADNGGLIEHLPYLIKSLERIGASAIIIEDKIGLKKNSLFKKIESL